jgi:HAD superfamily hydrolase (TIGR01509 family)
MFLSGFSVLLTDLDGTLLNTEPLHVQAHQAFARTKGFTLLESDLVGQVGKGDSWYYANYMQRHGITGENPKAWADAKNRILIEIYQSCRVEPMPGILDVLDRCLHQGIFAMIVTSCHRNVAQCALNSSGLNARLPVMIASEDVAKHKPDPEPYLLAARRLQVPPNRCLVLEDSIPGIQAGRSAGCTVVAMTGIVPADEQETAGAHMIVTDFCRLLER